jgi:hypothetical protein
MMSQCHEIKQTGVHKGVFRNEPSMPPVAKSEHYFLSLVKALSAVANRFPGVDWIRCAFYSNQPKETP